MGTTGLIMEHAIDVLDFEGILQKLPDTAAEFTQDIKQAIATWIGAVQRAVDEVAIAVVALPVSGKLHGGICTHTPPNKRIVDTAIHMDQPTALDQGFMTGEATASQRAG